MTADETDADRVRYERIGRLFCELWEMGAPWPVGRWSCDKHKVEGCLKCRGLDEKPGGEHAK